MSTLKVNNLQVGQDSTATNNLTWFQPGSPDGTIRLGSGNAGSATTKFTFDKDGNLTCVGDITANSIIAPIEGTLDDWIVHAGDTNTKFGFPAVDTFSIETAGSERLRITSDGYVGINETSPIHQLSIGINTSTAWDSTKNISNTTNNDFISLNLDNKNSGSNPEVGIMLQAGASGSGQYTINCRRSGSNTADLIFRTRDGGLASKETLRITSAGKVGINQAAPEALLHIEASSSGASWSADAADTLILERNGGCVIDFRTPSANDGGLIFSDNSLRAQGTLLYQHSDNSLRIGTNGEERFRIDSDGRVLLDTTSMGNTNAHTQCDDLVVGNTSHGHDTGVTIVSNPSYNGWLTFSDGTSTADQRKASIVYQHNQDTLYFRNNGNQNRLVITSTGQLKVGNNPTIHSGDFVQIEAPTSFNSGETIVTITGNSSTTGPRLNLKNLNTGANACSEVLGADAGGQSTGYIRFNHIDQTNNYGEISFGTRNAQGSPPAERLRIRSGGIVQIGDATANSADVDANHSKLTIKQSANQIEDGIYIERSGERRGFYIYVGGALSQNDALGIVSNQLGGDTAVLAIDRGGDIVVGAGNIKMPNGKGIDFSNNTDGGETSTFTTLEDYEEGTFTPHFEIETRSASDSPVDGVQGRYVKVGNVVTCHYIIQLNGTPNQRSTSRAWEIHGFPYTSKAGNSSGQMGGNQRVTGYETATYGPDGHFVFRLFNNTTYGRLEFIEHNYNGTRNASPMMLDNAQVIGTITYQSDG